VAAGVGLLERQASVGPVLVVVGHVLTEHDLEVSLRQDQHTVQTFPYVGVGPRFLDEIGPKEFWDGKTVVAT
jgi:hypothetical protein